MRCPLSQGNWDASSAGGGMGRPGYYTNPQYALVLTHPKTKVHVELKAPRDVSRGPSSINQHPSFVVHLSPFTINYSSLIFFTFGGRAVHSPLGMRVWVLCVVLSLM